MSKNLPRNGDESWAQIATSGNMYARRERTKLLCSSEMVEALDKGKELGISKRISLS